MHNRSPLHPLRVYAVPLLMLAALFSNVTAYAAGGGCGNAMLDAGETCDDGNTAIGDGCSQLCLVEAGFDCTAPYVPVTANVVPDGGFEAGGPSNFWNEVTDQNDGVLCNTVLCPRQFGSRRGAWWARLGSENQGGGSRINQEIMIPSSHTVLDFDIMLPLCDTSADFLEVTLDGNIVFFADGNDDLCFEQGHYERQTIDLRAAPGGPYNDDQVHNLTFRSQTFFQGDSATLFLVDNVRIGKQSGAPTPSVCEVDDNTAEYADFDPGIEGNFAALGYTTIELNDPVPWGTTDDGVCGSGDIPPGNFTGGAGEAACIDLNATGGADVLSFFCTDAIDLSNAIASQLEFLLNVQFAPGFQDDFFIVLAGDQPPEPATISNYTPVFQTNESQGVFAQASGELINVDLSQFDGIPQTYLCFGMSSTMAFYAQVDNMDVSFLGCTDDDDSDKLQSCFDNCSLRENPDQTDSDGDGYGNACDGDISRELGSGRVPSGNGNDCIINVVDLAFFREAFFSEPTSSNWNPDADFNNDLKVNAEDLGRLRQMFFMPPGPSGYTSACTPPP